MKTFITNNLNNRLRHQIYELIDLCKDVDHLKGCIYMEENMNIDPKLPCYIYCTEQHNIISFLSIFIPSEYSCEIYAYVHPDFRRKHIFTDMYNTAIDMLKKYNFSSIQFVCEPNSPGELLLLSKGYTHCVCECMMKYNSSLSPKEYKNYDIITNDNKDYFELMYNNIELGHCRVDYGENNATIYDVEIYEKHRGQGYSKVLINMILPYIQKSSIVLHVTASNTKALRAYTSCGFDIIEELHFYNTSL